MPEELTIFADKQRIQQAFMNLISNAVQAIQSEGKVEIVADNSRDGMVTAIISDTGVGISQEDLPKIFDPFFSTKDVGKGTGLGLFITHDIVVRHGGTIRATSVPRKRDHIHRRTSGGGAFRMNDTPRVLVIDDEEMALTNLEHILKKQGYDIVTANTGPRGLELARSGGFDIIITDLRMEKVDGMRILEECRAP